MIETLRSGRYMCLGTLGEGSQGTTFDGIDKRDGRAVAIKRFQVRGAKSWKDVELAEREARVLSSLAHPRLPAYVDHFEEDGALYLVMERIEGESLADLRKRGAVLGEDDIVRLLANAGEVLAYLHGRAPPVIHRDLKPGNVIRRPDGSYAFVDFGAVRDKLRPEGGSTVVGTFGYMAPEQFQGRASPGSDVYSIGATALAMLTGEEPETLPHKGLAIDVQTALRGRASPRLAEVLSRMLEPNPDVRPASLAPLLGHLEGRRYRPSEPAGKNRAAPRAARSRMDDLRAEWERKIEAARERWEREMEVGRLGWAGGFPSRKSWERAIDQGRRKWDRQIDEARRAWQRGDASAARRIADKWTKRAERNAARMRARAHRRGRPAELPHALLIPASIGLTLATIAVILSLRVVVPTVLTLLSILFGSKLRDAAGRVSDAGRRAGEAMERARAFVHRRPVAEAGIRVEADEPPARVRFSEEPGEKRVRVDSELEEQAEEEAAEAHERTARRGR